MARLREAPDGGITLRDLGGALRGGFTDEDLPWAEAVVRSLEKDGLAVLVGTPPGTADAVAEDRPAYGGGSPAAAGELGATLVRLP